MALLSNFTASKTEVEAVAKSATDLHRPIELPPLSHTSAHSLLPPLMKHCCSWAELIAVRHIVTMRMILLRCMILAHA